MHLGYTYVILGFFSVFQGFFAGLKENLIMFDLGLLPWSGFWVISDY